VGDRRPGINSTVILGNTTDQTEVSGPRGGLHRVGWGCPPHGPFRRDDCGVVLCEKREEVRQQGVGRMPLASHRTPEGEGGMERLAQGTHPSPPGHGSARVRQAP
jgi:hypothetical protein